MHDQNWYVELRGAIPGTEREAGRMKNRGLYVATRQQVLLYGSAPMRLPDECEPIAACAR